MSGDVVVSEKGVRVLVALRDAMATSGALAPHLYAIGNEVGPEMPYHVVRERLRGLVLVGLVEQQGDALEFSLTKAGETLLAEVDALGDARPEDYVARLPDDEAAIETNQNERRT